MVEAQKAKILLIVEDRADVGAAFARYFRRYFDQVRVATTPAQAQELLDEQPEPTHVICDHWLGDDYPVGAQLLPRWRREHPSIERCVLVSGSEIEEIDCPAGVDAIFGKPADMPAIRARLLG